MRTNGKKRKLNYGEAILKTLTNRDEQRIKREQTISEKRKEKQRI